MKGYILTSRGVGCLPLHPCRHKRRSHTIKRALSQVDSLDAVRDVSVADVVFGLNGDRLPQINASDQQIREGHYESSLVKKQASKQDSGQPSISEVLAPADLSQQADVAVVGCGPAGLYLAAQLQQKGVRVTLIGRDVSFVNNYGVWLDEFKDLGLEHTLDCSWPDAVCYFGEEKEVRVGRSYARVSRRKLREHLLGLCAAAGVRFVEGEVSSVRTADSDPFTSVVLLKGGQAVNTRMVTLAAGAAAGRFLQYESGAPSVAAQTAYGVEAVVEGYEDAYPRDAMLFMDFRRHHTGVWDGTASRLQAGQHPVGGDGLWGSAGEVPSFLYAMPLDNGRVFLEETCLVAKPALPFATLRRRLQRRLDAMGIKIKEVHEEEWSYIPVGGPMPLADQNITAFGAAANLVHPATGFSVSRSLREAPALAEHIRQVLSQRRTVAESSRLVWQELWPLEKRRQASFHVFGMELLAVLDLSATNAFFSTFFRLPDSYWRGFLSSSLDSSRLVLFALLVFVLAPPSIKLMLMRHLATDPAGKYLIKYYTASTDEHPSSAAPPSAGAGTAAAGGIALLEALTRVADTSA